MQDCSLIMSTHYLMHHAPPASSCRDSDQSCPQQFSLTMSSKCNFNYYHGLYVPAKERATFIQKMMENLSQNGNSDIGHNMLTVWCYFLSLGANIVSASTENDVYLSD